MIRVFVAHEYNQKTMQDYRKVFSDVQKAFAVHFVFPDKEITSQHIFEKIKEMIKGSEFCIFDLSRWNPNVTLELGYTVGINKKYHIVVNQGRRGQKVPSDLQGYGRQEYTSFSSLSSCLINLLTEERVSKKGGKKQQTDSFQNRVLSSLKGKTLSARELADQLGEKVPLMQLILRNMAREGIVKKVGDKRTARYCLKQGRPKT
jgi:hypothetical protein